MLIKTKIDHSCQMKSDTCIIRLAKLACYGYSKTSEGYPVINENEVSVVRWIFDCYLQGDSLMKIADTLTKRDIKPPIGSKRWSDGTLNCILFDRRYAGSMYPVGNNCFAIVSQEMFEATKGIRCKE